jgi:hypothetical protein
MEVEVGKRNQSGFHLLIIALVVVVLGVGGISGYEVYHSHHKTKKPTTARTTTVKKSTQIAAIPAPTAPSTAELDNIKASITSGNTAALEGYMPSSVNVVIAASGHAVTDTPTQAISELDYLSPGGTNTWDFALPAATLNGYQAGFYKQYFPASALVGKSSDGHVVSFQFDINAKISGIFMAAPDVL